MSFLQNKRIALQEVQTQEQKPFTDPRENLSSCAKRIIAVAVVCIGSLSETHLDRRRKSERRRKRRMKRGRGEREEAK